MIRYLSLLLLLFSSALKAQESNDTIITLPVARIFDTRIFLPEEAGIKTTKVDTLIMMDKLAQDLSDLLSENSHVFIKSYGRGAMATAAFRGTAPSHTQVYWNGININSPMLGMVDFSLIPVYILDDVSLNHGTSSIIDGNGGLGGSINLDNSARWESGFDLKFLQGAGMFCSFEDFLSLKTGNDRFQSETRLYYSSSKNDYTFVNRYNYDLDPESGEFIYKIDTNKNSDYLKYGVLQEFYYRERSGAVWSLRYWGQLSGRSIPGVASYEGPEVSRLNRISDDDHKIVLNRRFSSAKHTLELQSGFQYHFVNYYLKNYIPGYGYRNEVFSNSTVQSLFNKAEYRQNFSDNWLLNVTASWDYHEVSTVDTVTSAGYDNHRNDISLFVSLRKQFFNRLNTSLMLRQGFVDSELLPPAPFLGFDLLLAKERSIILKGNIGRNYHQPTLNDLYWMPGGNPDLKPEDGISTELGLEMIFESGNVYFVPGISLFFSDIDNWIIWLPTKQGYWEPNNVKRVVSKGLEASANISWRLGDVEFRSIATYSCTRALNYGDTALWGDESYGKQLVYIPVHSGNIMLSSHWRKWSLSWQNNSYSRRFTTSSNDLTDRYSFYPYFMNNLKIGRDFSFKAFNISTELKINNLFNEKYHSVLIQPMPGINAMFQLMIDLK